jgi:hypothetical protein
MIPKHYTDLFYREGRCPSVNHSMTVGTHWLQIGNGINFVFFPNCCERTLVVNVNETSTGCPISLLKVKPTNITAWTVMSDTLAAGGWVTLVCIDLYLTDCAFPKNLPC